MAVAANGLGTSQRRKGESTLRKQGESLIYFNYKLRGGFVAPAVSAKQLVTTIRHCCESHTSSTQYFLK
jgi:hypothetical protein